MADLTAQFDYDLLGKIAWFGEGVYLPGSWYDKDLAQPPGRQLTVTDASGAATESATPRVYLGGTPQPLDNFNRADGDIGSGWGGPVNDTNYQRWAISGNQIAWNGVASGSEGYWNARSFVADQYASVRMPHQPTVGSAASIWLLLQITNTTVFSQNCYVCAAAFQTGGSVANLTIYSCRSGSFTAIGSASGVALTDGDTLSAEIAGANLTMKVNGVAQCTATDPSGALGAGYIGVGVASDTSNLARLDDFSGGALTADSPVTDASGTVTEAASVTARIDSNLASNSSFETGIGGWVVAGAGAPTIALSTVQKHTGNASCALTLDPAGGAYASLSPNPAPVGGDTYTWTAWVYVPSGQGLILGALIVAMGDYTGTWQEAYGTSPTAFDTWQQLTVTKTIRPGYTALYFRVWYANNPGPGTVYFDDAFLVDATTLGPASDASGTVTESASVTVAATVTDNGTATETAALAPISLSTTDANSTTTQATALTITTTDDLSARSLSIADPNTSNTGINNRVEAQSFIHSGGAISSISLWLAKIGAVTDNLTLQVRDDGGNKVGSNVLGSATIALSSLPTTAGYVVIPISTSVLASGTYWFVFSRTANDNSNYYSYGARGDSAYANGGWAEATGFLPTIPTSAPSATVDITARIVYSASVAAESASSGTPISATDASGAVTESASAAPSTTPISATDTSGAVTELAGNITFPTTPVLDNFNRADGAIGANWSADVRDSVTPAPSISGNAIVAPTASSYTARWLPSTFGPDYEVYATVRRWQSGDVLRLYARLTDPGLDTGYDVYRLNANSTSGTIQLARYNDGNATTLIAPPLPALQVGDVIGLRVEGAIVTAVLVRGGSAMVLAYAVDSAPLPSTAAGSIAIELSDTTAGFSVDDFGGGTYVPVGVAQRFGADSGAATESATTGYPVSTTDANGAVTESASVSKNLYRQVILADGPRAYWKLDEASGDALDSTGNNYKLAPNGTLPTTPGLASEFTTARSFSGSAGGFSSYAGNILKFNTFTWELWIQRARTNATEDVIDQYNGGAALRITSSGVIQLNQSFVGVVSQTTTTKILDTNVHHLVITRAGIGGAVIFYLDGVAETGSATAPSTDYSAWGGGYAMWVGSEWGNQVFAGTLDEIAVYDYVLAPSRVAYHYAVGTGAVTPVFATDSGTATESAAVALSSADTNGATTESATAVPQVTPVSSSDTNGATTETQAYTFAQSTTDADGTLAEAVVLVAALPVTDTDGPVTETAAFAYAPAGTDASGTLTESTTQVITTSDASGATAETAAFTYPLATADSNGTLTEAASLRLSATDADGATTETQAYTFALSATDTDGATTETQTFAYALASTDTDGATTETAAFTAALTATDTNGATTEATNTRLTAADTDGATTETQAYTYALPSADTDGTTVEIATFAFPLSSTDADGATNETQAYTYPLATTDADGATVETQTFAFPQTTTDTDGATSESAAYTYALASSDTNGATAEAVVLAGKPSAIDTNTGVAEATASTAVLAVADTNGTTTELAASPSSAASADTSGTITETATVVTAAIPATDTDGTPVESFALAAVLAPTTDASGATVETSTTGAPLIVTDTSTGVDAVVALAAQIPGTDTTSEVEQAALALVATDTSTATEGTALQVPASGTDTSTAADAQALTATLASADTTSEVETASAGAPLSTADTSGTASEIVALTAAVPASDADGTPVETAAFSYSPVTADASGTVTETLALQVLTADTSGTPVETQVVLGKPTSTDTNSGEVENATTNTPLLATDTNAPSTEATAIQATVSATDTNGVAAETAAASNTPTVTDASGGVVDSPTLTAALPATDTGTATETVTVVGKPVASDGSTESELATPVANILAGEAGTATDTASLAAGASQTVTDFAAAAADVALLLAKIPTADTNAGTVEAEATTAQIPAPDAGHVVETATASATASTADTAGVPAEVGTPFAQVQNGDAPTSTNETPGVGIVSADASIVIEDATVQIRFAFVTAIDTNGTVLEAAVLHAQQAATDEDGGVTEVTVLIGRLFPPRAHALVFVITSARGTATVPPNGRGAVVSRSPVATVNGPTDGGRQSVLVRGSPVATVTEQ